MYKEDALERVTGDELCEEDMIISGMYYMKATGDFYWDQEIMKAFVNMTYGPRYARGYSYNIRIEDDVFLKMKK